jgi:hypothetical protein
MNEVGLEAETKIVVGLRVTATSITPHQIGITMHVHFQNPALKRVRLGAGQRKEEGRGMGTDVEIVSYSSEVRRLQGRFELGCTIMCNRSQSDLSFTPSSL